MSRAYASLIFAAVSIVAPMQTAAVDASRIGAESSAQERCNTSRKVSHLAWRTQHAGAPNREIWIRWPDRVDGFCRPPEHLNHAI